MMFFYLDSKVEWNIERSIHAFIDDILFRACSLQDVRTVFDAFDGPARSLGLNLNVNGPSTTLCEAPDTPKSSHDTAAGYPHPTPEDNQGPATSASASFFIHQTSTVK